MAVLSKAALSFVLAVVDNLFKEIRAPRSDRTAA
jgi:hypothetical protein